MKKVLRVISYLVVFIVLILVFHLKSSPTFAATPKGWLDVASPTEVSGWTCDKDDFAAKLKVDIYVDGPVGIGTKITNTTANNVVIAGETREKAVADQCGNQAAHGYKITNTTILAKLRDGSEHTVYAYGVNFGSGVNKHLSGSPKPSIGYGIAPVPVTKTVCATGTAGQNGCDFIGGNGIQAAVNAVPNGRAANPNTIRIRAGNYTRQTYTSYTGLDGYKRKVFIDTKGKNISLIGDIGAKLDGANSVNMFGIAIGSGTVKVQNIIINGFKRDSNCNYTATTTCSRGFGILVERTSNVSLLNNILFANAQGLVMSDTSIVNSTNNLFVSNTYDGGINVHEHSHLISKNDIVAFNLQGSGDDDGRGYFCDGSAVIDIAYSLASQNARGNFDKNSNTCTINGQSTTLQVDPKFVNEANGNFHLFGGTATLPASPARNAGDPAILDPDGTISDMGAYGGPDGALGCAQNLQLSCGAGGTSGTFSWNSLGGASSYVLRINRHDNPPSPTPEWMSAGDQWISVPQDTGGITSKTTTLTPNSIYDFKVQGVADGDVYPYNSCNTGPVTPTFSCSAVASSPTPTQTPTPSPTPTTSPLLTIPPGCSQKIIGDANCDGVVNGADYGIWKNEFLRILTTLTASFDLNQVIDLNDFEIWRKNMFAPAPTCSVGQAYCSGSCVDVTTPQRCGSCNNVCSTGQLCVSGACYTPPASPTPTPTTAPTTVPPTPTQYPISQQPVCGAGQMLIPLNPCLEDSTNDWRNYDFTIPMNLGTFDIHHAYIQAQAAGSPPDGVHQLTFGKNDQCSSVPPDHGYNEIANLPISNPNFEYIDVSSQLTQSYDATHKFVKIFADWAHLNNDPNNANAKKLFLCLTF